MAETKMDAAQEEFEKWWKPQTKPGERFHGCSQNWGAREAWRAARQAADARVQKLEADIEEFKRAANLLIDYCEDHDWGTMPEPFASINPLLKLLGRVNPVSKRCPRCGHNWKFGEIRPDECGFHQCACKHEWHAIPRAEAESILDKKEG
jgi:hypothetical protein